MFKKIAAVFFAAFVTAASAATTYNFILPNPAGSLSDVAARAIADEYARISGNNLVIDYAPGGDHIIAANKFRAATRPTVLLGTTTMHVFNYATKDSLPYQHSDFDHVGWISWSAHFWYVKADSKFTTMEQVVEHIKKGLPVNVGVDGMSTQANVMSVKKFRPDSASLQMINYPGSPRVLADVLGGHLDIGISTLSNLVSEQAAAGNIRLLATTNATPMMIHGKTIPTADKILGVEQFNGGMLISVSPKFNTEENQKLKRDLLQALNSESVKKALAAVNNTVDGRDGVFTTELLENYVKSVSAVLK